MLENWKLFLHFQLVFFFWLSTLFSSQYSRSLISTFCKCWFGFYVILLVTTFSIYLTLGHTLSRALLCDSLSGWVGTFLNNSRNTFGVQNTSSIFCYLVAGVWIKSCLSDTDQCCYSQWKLINKNKMWIIISFNWNKNCKLD